MLRAVDADQIVGDGTGFGGTVEVIVIAAGFELIQPVTDGTVGQRGNPQADERLAATEVVVNIAEDSFAFTTRIGCTMIRSDWGENFVNDL